MTETTSSNDFLGNIKKATGINCFCNSDSSKALTEIVPCKFVWEIKKFTYENKLSKNFRSETFVAKKKFNHNFYLKLYPYGKSESKNVMVLLFLESQIDDNCLKTVELKWKFYTNENKVEWSKIRKQSILKNTNAPSRNYLSKTIMSIDDLKNVNSNEVIKFHCEIQIVEDIKYDVKVEKQNIIAVNELYDLWKASHNSDVTFVIGRDNQKSEFKAHRQVLACQSLFASILPPDNVNEHEIKSIESDSFEIFIQYIYTGRIAQIEDAIKLANQFRECTELAYIGQEWLKSLESMAVKDEEDQVDGAGNTDEHISDDDGEDEDDGNKSKKGKTKKETFNGKVDKQIDAHLQYIVDLHNELKKENVFPVKNPNIPDTIENNLDYVKRNYNLEFRWLLEKTFPFNETKKYNEKFLQFLNEKNGFKFSNNFVYFLLDPQILGQHFKDPSLRYETLMNGIGNLEPSLFATFIRAIFYVGIGANKRPLGHFRAAYRSWDTKATLVDDESDNKNDIEETEKINRIIDIWNKGHKPMWMLAFSRISEAETKAREAVMIDVLRTNLTNDRRGNYTMNLNMHERFLLGPYFVYQAFGEFLGKGGQEVSRDTITLRTSNTKSSPGKVQPVEPQPGPSTRQPESINSELINELSNMKI